jgi:DNA recombination protein RmuC
MMIFLFGIASSLCGVSIFLNVKLLILVRNLQNKEREMMQDLNSYSALEQSFTKEKQLIKEKHDAIITEKDRVILELKESFAVQLKDLKQDMEKRLLDEKNNHETIKESFSNIANNILEQKGKNLQEQSLHNIKHILEPFKTDIGNFKQLIHTVQSERTQQHASLETQIKNLQKHEKDLMLTAENLTKALKGENKTQGNWGEMIVRKILDSAGLIEGEHYTEQGKGMELKNEEGKREQPDFIINLPNNKHIILDAKVSLTHYERFCTENNEADLKGFANSIKNHIAQLAEKKYHENAKLNTPDFTMMFIPIESAYFLAVQHDQTLYETAWKRRIALCCPSTLLAMLQTVSNLWEIDMQNKNTQEIVNRAVNIYKKFEGFTKDLSKVGDGIKGALKNYEEAEKKFISGQGNLDGQFRKMISLVKVDKNDKNTADHAQSVMIEE